MRPECERAAAAYQLVLPTHPLAGRSGDRLGRATGSSLEFMDFRDYQWGDEMLMLLPADKDNAVVVGEKCRRAISTMRWGVKTKRDITELPNFFDDFDEACRYVAQRRAERWNQSVKHSDYLVEADLITLADFGF